VFVRTDIPVQHQMAQACHGSLESGNRFPNPSGNDPSFIVVIGVPDVHGLDAALLCADKAGIRTALFFEPDWDYGYTSFGTEPISKDRGNRAFRRFDLWKPNCCA